jgi:hypothetical protein
VGKSTLAGALARESAAGGLSVKVADLDVQQGDSRQLTEKAPGGWSRTECFGGELPERRIGSERPEQLRSSGAGWAGAVRRQIAGDEKGNFPFDCC